MAHSNPFLIDQSLAGDRQVDAFLINHGKYDKLKKQMISIIKKLSVKDKEWTPQKHEITSDDLSKAITERINFLTANSIEHETIVNRLKNTIEQYEIKQSKLLSDNKNLEQRTHENSKTIVELTKQKNELSSANVKLESDKNRLTKTINDLTEKTRTNEQKKIELEVNIFSLKTKLSETAKEVQEANYELELRALRISKMQTEIKKLSAQNEKLQESIQRLRGPHPVVVYDNSEEHEQEHGEGTGSPYTTIDPNPVVENSKKKMEEQWKAMKKELEKEGYTNIH